MEAVRRGAHHSAPQQRNALCEGKRSCHPHSPLVSLRYPTRAGLKELEGCGQPKRLVANEVTLSNLGRIGILRRFGVAEAEVLALWRKRASPAGADEGDVGAFSEGDSSDGYKV